MGSSHAADRQLLDIVRDRSLTGGELVTASVLVEPTHNNKQQFGSRRNSVNPPTDEEAIQVAGILVDGTPPPNRREDGGGDSEDRTDFAPKANSNPPKPEPVIEDEDGCGIKCLYYTMQCCECTLM